MVELTQKKIVELMNEAWKRRVEYIDESLKSILGSDDVSISPETTVRHKGSKLVYTVNSVTPDSVILRTPEGDEFSIDEKEFGEEYELE